MNDLDFDFPRITDFLHNYNVFKKELMECPTEVHYGHPIYETVILYMFGEYCKYDKSCKECLPSFRICKASYKNEYSEGVEECRHKNGRYVLQMRIRGVLVFVSFDMDQLVKFVLFARPKQLKDFLTGRFGYKYSQTDIFEAYSSLLQDRILSMNPKYRFANKTTDWTFYVRDPYGWVFCDCEKVEYIKMLRIIAMYMEITCKWTHKTHLNNRGILGSVYDIKPTKIKEKLDINIKRQKRWNQK